MRACRLWFYYCSVLKHALELCFHCVLWLSESNFCLDDKDNGDDDAAAAAAEDDNDERSASVLCHGTDRLEHATMEIQRCGHSGKTLRVDGILI